MKKFLISLVALTTTLFGQINVQKSPAAATLNEVTGSLVIGSGKTLTATGNGTITATGVAASGITGTLPVANGGTNLTAVGTSGNLLTSNGTAWVSTAPAPGITGLTAGRVPYAASSTTLTDASTLTFSGGTLTASAFLGASLTAPASTDLTLSGGSSGASLVLGATTTGQGILTTSGSAVGSLQFQLQVRESGGTAKGLIIAHDSTSQTGVLYPSTTGAAANLAVWNWNGSSLAETARFSANRNLLVGTTSESGLVGAGGIKVGSATAATTTTSGALIVAGGVGVSGAGYFGGLLNVAGQIITNTGTAAAPIISLNGTANGLYYTGANIVRIAAAGVEAATFAGSAANFTGTVTSAGLNQLDVTNALGRALIVGPVAQSGGNLPYASIKTSASFADFALNVENTNSTSGQGLGLRIVSGSTASDLSLYVRDRTNATTLFSVGGTGAATFAGAVTAASLATTQTPSTADSVVSTHKVPIVLNGTTYYILLTNVP